MGEKSFIVCGAMFVRLKKVNSAGRSYSYLHIVENFREGGRVRQRVIGTLGRLEELQEKGDLERVITQLVEHCPAVRLLRAETAGQLRVVRDQLWGPVLIFERLWEELGLPELLRRAGRRCGFDLERQLFAQVLQRFLEPGSDLAGSKWVATVHGRGFGEMKLMNFYRALSLVWKHKEEIEESLYRRGLDLFNRELDVVFFDTTSTYFEGTKLAPWARLGKSRGHRPDHLQLVVGVVLRRDGMPVCCEIWPGNMADVKTLLPVVEAMKKRFGIRRVVLVCDRGMVSVANLKALERARFEYIVGMKMRGLVEVRDEVLGRAGRYQQVNEKLQVKQVRVGRRRYVVCFNPEEASKDRRDREAILEKIRKKLSSGGVKALIANRGYRRYLKFKSGAAQIDEKRVREDERYDGKYVLRTTAELPATEVAMAYKELCWIERLWRELKDVVEVRPVYHWIKKDNVRGHIFVCFLSLYLAALLRKKLAAAGLCIPWDEIIRDLSSVRAVTVELGGEHYLLRSPLAGFAGKIFAAVGVKPPPLAQVAEAPEPAPAEM